MWVQIFDFLKDYHRKLYIEMGKSDIIMCEMPFAFWGQICWPYNAMFSSGQLSRLGTVRLAEKIPISSLGGIMVQSEAAYYDLCE